LDLGVQSLTGNFPKKGEYVEKVPVTVIKCKSCGLVQLKETTDANQMFGQSYGYSSALNSQMVSHLEELSNYSRKFAKFPAKGQDKVLDIGANDGTFLSFFGREGKKLIAVDPSIINFEKAYENHEENIETFPDFFDLTRTPALQKYMNSVHLVTSIACFYDLDDPIKFAKDVTKVLTKDGVWVMEAAYLGAILDKICVDGFVHEHLSYYSLRDIHNIAKKCKLNILDVTYNDCNGGSFRVVLSKRRPTVRQRIKVGKEFFKEGRWINDSKTYDKFAYKCSNFKADFVALLNTCKVQGLKVNGFGASTKLNVLLQYCNVDSNLMKEIGEVNPTKFGKVTPGTNIPIVKQDKILDRKNSDVLIIGPYHFRTNILNNPKVKKFIEQGGRVVFPLPKLEVISKEEPKVKK